MSGKIFQYIFFNEVSIKDLFKLETYIIAALPNKAKISAYFLRRETGAVICSVHFNVSPL